MIKDVSMNSDTTLSQHTGVTSSGDDSDERRTMRSTSMQNAGADTAVQDTVMQNCVLAKNEIYSPVSRRVAGPQFSEAEDSDFGQQVTERGSVDVEICTARYALIA